MPAVWENLKENISVTSVTAYHTLVRPYHAVTLFSCEKHWVLSSLKKLLVAKETKGC